MVGRMQERLIRSLSDRRREIHRRWDALLHLEPAETPLANPDTLVHMIDWTLDKVFNELRSRIAYHCGERPRDFASLRAHCHCGNNPFFKHFLAGEQALLEALVLVQSEDASLKPVYRDTAVAELFLVINEIARCEVESLCSLCMNSPRPKRQSSVALEENEV
jgi:hypothetical protein